MRYFFGLIYGLVYGVAHIIPGLSGGTFLVIFGCYDTVCEAFALNIKEIKQHFFFLLFFGVGTIGGLIGFAHVITFLLNGFEIQTNLFFMGLVLGGLPLIIKIASSEEKVKPICLLPFIVGVIIVVSLVLFEKLNVFEAETVQSVGFMFSLRIVFYSFIAAVAMVMPGISGAFVLVAFGVYDMYMTALKEMDFTVLGPAIIGVLFGIVIGAKLILLILKKFKLIVYSAIIGMVIGSVVPLLPNGFGLNIETFTGLICLALGGGAAYIMGKKEEPV